MKLNYKNGSTRDASCFYSENGEPQFSNSLPPSVQVKAECGHSPR